MLVLHLVNYSSVGLRLFFGFLLFNPLCFLGLTTLFLITKEIAYIPLAATTKARGKSITDFLFVGTGVWLGTSSVSLFNLAPMNQNIESILHNYWDNDCVDTFCYFSGKNVQQNKLCTKLGLK